MLLETLETVRTGLDETGDGMIGVMGASSMQRAARNFMEDCRIHVQENSCRLCLERFGMKGIVSSGTRDSCRWEKSVSIGLSGLTHER
jgi:hypothetical protein